MPEFKYDDDKHLYTLDNVPLTNVTTLLASVGVNCADSKMKANGRQMWKPINDVRWISDDGGRAAQFGTNLHEIGKWLLQGIECDYDPSMEPWVANMRKFIKEFLGGYEILSVEVPMYHKRMLFAGTADFFAKNLKTGKIGCFDWKTGEVYQEHWRYQMAAYTELAEDFLGIKCDFTASVQIGKGELKKPTMRAGYKFRQDLSHWKSILNVYKLMTRG